jgi:hypothetical protein
MRERLETLFEPENKWFIAVVTNLLGAITFVPFKAVFTSFVFSVFSIISLIKYDSLKKQMTPSYREV